MSDTVNKLVLADADSVSEFSTAMCESIGLHCTGYGAIAATAKVLAAAIIETGTQATDAELDGLSILMNDADTAYNKGGHDTQFVTYRRSVRETTKKSGIVLNAYATNDGVGYRYPVESLHLESCTPTVSKAKGKKGNKGNKENEETDNQSQFPVRNGDGLIDIDKHVRTILQDKDIDFHLFLAALLATQSDTVIYDSMRLFGFIPIDASAAVYAAVASDIDADQAADIVAAADALERKKAEASREVSRRANTVAREAEAAEAEAAEADKAAEAEAVKVTEAEATAIKAVKVAKAEAVAAKTGNRRNTNRNRNKGNTGK